MAGVRQLSRAPITEAIVDFRVTLPAEVGAGSFLSVKEQLRERYPTAEEQRAFKTRLEFREGKPAAADTKFIAPQGYFFKSQDGLDVAQFRVDGFTYNRLAPYTSWDRVLPEALSLWDVFVRVARPWSLDRLALRYINRLRLPGSGDLSRYLTVHPPAFPGAPRGVVAGFLTRISTVDPESGLSAHVTQALERDLEPGSSVVILDIDVYTSMGLMLTAERIRDVLERLHETKNEVFFGCITEETAGMYE